jgi:hypothetical protein
LELDNQPSSKRTSDEPVPSHGLLGLDGATAQGSGLSADAVVAQPPMSAGELFFACRLADMNVKDCKQFTYVKKCFTGDNRPFFKGKLMKGVESQADILVLVWVHWLCLLMKSL